MNRASQILHGSADRWLAIDSKQQLYFVAAVSCVLLVGVQGFKLVKSRLQNPPQAPESVFTGDSAATNQAPVSFVEVPAAPSSIVASSAESNAELALQVDDQRASALAAEVEVEETTTIVATQQNQEVSPAGDGNESSPASVTTDSASAAVVGVEQATSVEPADQDAKRAFATDETPAADGCIDPAQEIVSVADESPPFGFALGYAIQQQQTAQDRTERNRALAAMFGGSVAESAPATSDDAPAPTVSATQDAVMAETFTELASESSPASAPDEGLLATKSADSEDVVNRTESSATSTPLSSGRDELIVIDAEDLAPADFHQGGEDSALVLVLVNPADSGGPIFYLVDGESFALNPSESHRLPATGERTVAFHRGEDWGDTELVLQSGVFTFRVTTQGWQLEAASAGSAP